MPAGADASSLIAPSPSNRRDRTHRRIAVTPAILVPAHCIGLDITGPIGLLLVNWGICTP